MRLDLALPRIGQGTWMMGESASKRGDELAALRLGLDLGMSLIDTAEMYAAGAAEELVGEAIAGRRDELILVSKVLPSNASREGTLHAAERSLKRLGTDRIDLYLLHWPGSHPLEATYEAFEILVEQGKVLHYGVSNFDVDDLERSESIPAGRAVGVNQVLYNLERRSIERRLIPWCRDREIGIMAYSPLEQGRLQVGEVLDAVAAGHGCTPEQVALAWTIRDPEVVAIPKAIRQEHVRRNASATEIVLSAEELALLDEAFPVPQEDRPLEML